MTAEEQPEETKEELDDFWAVIKAKLKAAQEWAKEVIASLKANQKGAAEQESESSDQGSAPS